MTTLKQLTARSIFVVLAVALVAALTIIFWLNPSEILHFAVLVVIVAAASVVFSWVGDNL